MKIALFQEKEQLDCLRILLLDNQLMQIQVMSKTHQSKDFSFTKSFDTKSCTKKIK